MVVAIGINIMKLGIVEVVKNWMGVLAKVILGNLGNLFGLFGGILGLGSGFS